jgi:hypothetical protein
MAKEAEKARLWHDFELKLVRFLNYCAKFCVAIASIFLPQEYRVGSWGDSNNKIPDFLKEVGNLSQANWQKVLI